MVNEFKKHIDKSGKMFRKEYLEKYFPEILILIENFCTENNLNLPFKQKVYHWINDLKTEAKCLTCGRPVKFKNSTIGYHKFCSNKCIGKSEIIKDKKISNSLEKWGKEYPQQNYEVKEKAKKTNIEKYGTISAMQNEDIKQKSKTTCLENYGVESPLKSKEIMERVKKTNLEKYGVENVKQNPEIEKKIKKTNLERYGVEYAMQNENIKEKSKKLYLESIRHKYMNYYKDLNVVDLDINKKEYTVICEKGHQYKINYVLLNSRKRTKTEMCTICNPLCKSISGLQIQLINFIKENFSGEILEADRKILDGKELDIYLPELKLAFEFNGLYWHSELNKPKDYHINKTNDCQNKEVQLIHIWEDDWLYKQDIVKSMILNKLGKTPNKIMGRKCEIREITDNIMVRCFLDDNHIQGFVGSSVKLGLFYNSELVSLMCFGKNRLGIGNFNSTYELLRFCNKLNTTVVGSASKLFNYFIKNYQFDVISTFADRSHSNGNIYKKLGFNLDYITKPNYSYVVEKCRKHRMNFRKSFFEDIEDKTEHQIMMERGIFRIYNSGNMKFSYISIK